MSQPNRTRTCGRSAFNAVPASPCVCKNYRILGVDLDGSFFDYIVLPETVPGRHRRTLPPGIGPPCRNRWAAVDAALVEDLTGHTVLITGAARTGLCRRRPHGRSQ